MKKIFKTLFVLVVMVVLSGCASSNIEGSLTDIMDKLYEGIDNLPKMLETNPLNDENIEYYIFTDDVEFKEAVFSESMTGSIAHSVVLIRLEDASDAEDVVKEIKENANPRKWICVEAKNVIVESKGDLVMLVMTDNEDNPSEDDIAPLIKKNFENLK